MRVRLRRRWGQPGSCRSLSTRPAEHHATLRSSFKPDSGLTVENNLFASANAPQLVPCGRLGRPSISQGERSMRFGSRLVDPVEGLPFQILDRLHPARRTEALDRDQVAQRRAHKQVAAHEWIDLEQPDIELTGLQRSIDGLGGPPFHCEQIKRMGEIGQGRNRADHRSTDRTAIHKRQPGAEREGAVAVPALTASLFETAAPDSSAAPEMPAPVRLYRWRNSARKYCAARKDPLLPWPSP